MDEKSTRKPKTNKINKTLTIRYIYKKGDPVVIVEEYTSQRKLSRRCKDLYASVPFKNREIKTSIYIMNNGT